MHDTIGEGGGADATRFGRVDLEVNVGAGTPRTIAQGGLQSEQAVGELVFEGGECGFGSFSACGEPPRTTCWSG